KLMGPNTFRPNSRQFCNFGMPPEIDRPISLSKFKQLTFSNPRLNSYESLWTDDQKNELEDLFYCLYEVRYLDLNRDDSNNKNQCEKQVDHIRSLFKARWAAFKDQHARLNYLITLIDEAGRVGLYSHIVSRNEEVAILEPGQNHNGVESALTQLSGPYKNYLLEDLDKTSQKHKKMHENIESGPGHEGPIFIYSSFRTMEGIEIFSRELNVRGYRKFDPYKDLIVDKDQENQDKDKDKDREPNKLYAIISGEESTELRTQILNFFNHPRNIRGAYLKILLGTSASAQGLSLLNCRQVHIMEPWWTLVLILQVIGRVCRIRSHHALPIDERNVYVYEYLSTLSKEQSQEINNEELSTDEYLYLKAIEKDELNQQFYVLLKEIAIDVVISAQENRPLENGLKASTGLGFIQQENTPYSLWKRDSSSSKKPLYNYMPNIFDDSIPFTETTLSILGTTSNSATSNSDKNTSISYSIKTVDRKYIAISVKGEKYICFIDKNNKAEFTKKLFKGDKMAIKVIELYDFRSMKFSQSCVLRAYLDEANNVRNLDMVKV
ncbi:MAG: helicase C-terminal domain-containing protein, partial [Candidatus Paceibacterota bacterium]